MNNDYDYGRSSGLYMAATAAGIAACDATDPAVKKALYDLRDSLVEKADALSNELRANDQAVTA